MTERYIVGAALQLKENPEIVIVADDHCSKFMIDQLIDLDLIKWGQTGILNIFRKGYIDNKGSFLSVQEAFLIAKDAGQLDCKYENSKEELNFFNFNPNRKIFSYSIRFLNKNGEASLFVGPNYNFIMKLIYAVGFKAYNHEYGFAVLQEDELVYFSTIDVKNKFGTDYYKMFRSL